MVATTTDALGRALDAHAAIFAAGADEHLELSWGRAWRSTVAPTHPDLNLVCVQRPADLTAGELAATVSRLGARIAEVWDARTAERLRPALEAAGWETERFLLMAFEGDPPAPAAGVVETGYAALEPLRREWILGTPGLEHVVEEDIAANHRILAGTPTRCFLLEGASMALLIGDGPVRMIEDVYTTPAQRGRGLAAAVVRTALAAARDTELVFLPTDADGQAQRLYRRLGFAPLGVVLRFRRP